MKTENTEISHTLVISPCEKKDAGRYTLHLQNPLGDVSVNIRVKVVGPPGPPTTPFKGIPDDNGGSDISNYIVEKRIVGQKRWYKVSSNVARTNIFVSRLEKDYQYLFRVAAENQYGIGPFIETDGPVTASDPNVPPDMPEHLDITRVTRKTVELVWKRPKYDGGSPITGYIVESRNLKGSRRTDIAPPGGSHNQDISSFSAIFTINTSSLEAPKPSVTEIWPAGATGAEDLEGSRRTEIAPHNQDILLLGHIHNKHFVSLASQQSTVDISPYGGSQDILLLGHVQESHYVSAEGSRRTVIAPPGHNQDILLLGHIHNQHSRSVRSRRTVIAPPGHNQDILLLGHIHNQHSRSAARTPRTIFGSFSSSNPPALFKAVRTPRTIFGSFSCPVTPGPFQGRTYAPTAENQRPDDDMIVVAAAAASWCETTKMAVCLIFAVQISTTSS
ncbi:Titin-like [Branchiostoma belcheri]|nr:Titin-like [Branchiostoma belcheri]